MTLINGIGTFADEYAGVNKVVTFSDFRLEGSDKDNYILTQPPTVIAEIDKRELLIIATASDRDYDATTNASVILSDNRVSGDEFEIHTAPTNFVDKNAGVDKPVTVTGIIITGDDAVNYTWNTEATTKATVRPIYLTISGVVASQGGREYDGTIDAPFETSGAILVGNMIGSDNVSLNKEHVTGTFADKNVGVDKPITILGFAIESPNDVNYKIIQPSLKATIVAEGLAVVAQGINKVYDGKTDAVVTLTPDPTEMVAGDVLTFTYDADFADKNAADGKTVNVNGITISSGNEAGNYILEETTASTTANISKKELSVIAVAMSKVYDGDVDADADVTLTPDPQDVAAGDVLTLGFAEAHFSDKYVAAGKTVTVEGIEIKTGNAGNYFLKSTTETPKADITPLDLTVNARVLDKVYNDNTDVVVTTVSLTSTNTVRGDVLNYAFNKATFSDENVGDRTVFVEDIAISGTESVNYKLVNPTATVNAKITPKDLTVAAVGVNKVYDGTNKAVVTFTTPDLGDDVMEYDYTATFRDKDVDEDGIAIPVTVTNIILKGDEAGNYKLINALANTTAKITPRELKMTGVTADDKLYNGNTVVVLHTDNAILVDMKNPELNLIALDDVKFISDLAIGEFADKNAGLAKPINVSLFKIAGDPNEHNYSLVQPSPTANITPVKLRITGVTAEDKSYDGNKVATLNIGSTDLKLVGVLTGDTVALVSSTAKGEFEVKDVSEYQKVTTKDFTLSGDDAVNYEVMQPIILASITDQDLALTAIGDSKIYDSEDDATVTLTGWVANDDVRVVSYKAIFANDHVSDAPINITVTDIVLEGVDLKNYDFPAGISVNTEANITPRTLKIKGVTAENKAFNHSYTNVV